MRPRGRQRPLDAALAYAARGWQVFPCHTPIPAGCSCRQPGCSSPGKHPRPTRGLRDATTDQQSIERWWTRWPGANVAIRTGAESGLVVLDIDPPHGGHTSLAAVVAEHGALPRGRTVRTGSGGAHIYLAHPGVKVRNNAGTKLGPGIDVRGDGGYVIAPPSRHASGAVYAWENRAPHLPAMPDWLVGQLRPPERRAPTPLVERDRALGTSSSWARAALEGELAQVRAAQEGQRNATLNRAAFCLGQVVAGGALDKNEVEGLLVDAGLSTGLGEREARLTVSSGLTAGYEYPRGPTTQTRPPSTQRSPASPPATRPELSLPVVDVGGVDLRTIALDGALDIGGSLPEVDL